MSPLGRSRSPASGQSRGSAPGSACCRGWVLPTPWSWLPYTRARGREGDRSGLLSGLLPAEHAAARAFGDQVRLRHVPPRSRGPGSAEEKPARPRLSADRGPRPQGSSFPPHVGESREVTPSWNAGSYSASPLRWQEFSPRASTSNKKAGRSLTKGSQPRRAHQQLHLIKTRKRSDKRPSRCSGGGDGDTRETGLCSEHKPVHPQGSCSSHAA